MYFHLLCEETPSFFIVSSFKLKYSLCGPELQSKLINNTIYCEIHYDSLIYPLTHSSDLNQADQEIVLGVNTDSVTLSFPSSKINQDFVTMILKYGEDELSVKIPVQTLVSGCRHHHYLIDMDSTTESKIELDFVIKALDISQFAIRFEFLLQNMNDKDYYIMYFALQDDEIHVLVIQFKIKTFLLIWIKQNSPLEKSCANPPTNTLYFSWIPLFLCRWLYIMDGAVLSSSILKMEDLFQSQKQQFLSQQCY